MKQSTLNRMRIFTALAGVVLAFAGFVHAGSVGTQRSQKAEKAKKGTLKIATTRTWEVSDSNRESMR
jgi:hypothetical protein